MALVPHQRARVDGLTGQRQRAFLRALANDGNYRRAAAVCVTHEAIRKLRRLQPRFQAL